MMSKEREQLSAIEALSSRDAVYKEIMSRIPRNDLDNRDGLLRSISASIADTRQVATMNTGLIMRLQGLVERITDCITGKSRGGE